MYTNLFHSTGKRIQANSFIKERGPNKATKAAYSLKKDQTEIELLI